MILSPEKHHQPGLGHTPRRRRIGALHVLALAGSLAVTVPASALDRGEPVAAVVNGQPIYKSEVDRCVPSDTFDATATDAREGILNRLIIRAELRQFLTTHRVNVADKDVDSAVDYLERFPPTMGCICHRYPSLDSYLRMNDYTLSDFRKDLRNQVGLAQYIQTAWQMAYPDKASQDALVAAQRARLEVDYTHAWHIFFNTFPQATEHHPPDVVRAEAKKRAEAAWQRLQKGESFESVARALSEDQVTAAQGGALGFLRKSNYGQPFEAELATLKPGEVSRPVESVLGFHIIKWQPIPDDELISITKADFLARTSRSTVESITRGARVVRN